MRNLQIVDVSNEYFKCPQCNNLIWPNKTNKQEYYVYSNRIVTVVSADTAPIHTEIQMDYFCTYCKKVWRLSEHEMPKVQQGGSKVPPKAEPKDNGKEAPVPKK